MNLNTYLGPKGYTIYKHELSIKQQTQIKNDLLIKPHTHGAPNGNDIKVFPVYRESSNKLYVPHYYGVEHFGKPLHIKINDGINIDISFNGILRDYQIPVVNKYLDHCKKDQYGGGLLELPCAWGKTSGSLYILSQLKKKTIVIVHKEFLLNQWIERIHQFLPMARIGKIQGPIIDIKDKDIVLCMLQSLVIKDYPQEIFDDFGLTIIDEVHHISSQTFSTALFKIVTKNMLGLSATMDRKDGTTHVFKMFLGDIIHKVERKSEDNVQVRVLTYKSNDDDFNETILDYRGNPQISSMISKLCSYNKRTEFIIKTLVDFIQVDNVDKDIIREHKNNMDKNCSYCELCNKNINYLLKNTCCNTVKYCLLCLNKIVDDAKEPVITINNKTNVAKKTKKRPKCPNCMKVLAFEQNYIENPYVKPLSQTHTIVMSHNLNVLEYMYNKIVCKNLASVGYYVGGMSEVELKKSENKQIILSSYQMAQEGLDIPTLNAEFLITPKTDIVQTIGRILRAKHAISNPIIYDFVDTHEVFQRQWLKRKTYYKKQNYEIIGTNSFDYDNNIWKNIYKPTNNNINNNIQISNQTKINTKINTKKTISVKSNCSTDISITSDSDEDDNEDNDNNEPPKCLLKFCH